MPKRQRHDASIIVPKAEEMARSRRYENWLGIEFALRSLGFDTAREALDRDWVRERLDELCGQSKLPKS
jgi:hypothetical protein